MLGQIHAMLCRSAVGLSTLAVAACGNSGVALTEAAQAGKFERQNTSAAYSGASSAVSESEIRKFLAKQIVDDPRLGNPPIVGRRKIVDAKISGPSMEKDWLTGGESKGYCVNLIVKNFYYGTADRETSVSFAVRNTGPYLSAKTTVHPYKCSEPRSPFPEVEELSSSLAAKV